MIVTVSAPGDHRRQAIMPDSSGFLSGGGKTGALMRAIDWSSTTLGPPTQWPQSLRSAVSICLGSRYPIVIWWDRHDYIQFYNDAYISFLGTAKHPGFLGRSGRDCWQEIWPVIGPMLDSVYATGEATWSEDLLLVLDRNLPREEGYFTFSYSAIRDDEGSIGGIFCTCYETTARVIGERRLETLCNLSRMEAEKTAEEACEAAARTLRENQGDIPFALIYLLDQEGRHARLVASTGLQAGSAASPSSIDLRAVSPATPAWPLQRVVDTWAAHLVANAAEQFGPLPGGLWPESSRSALIVPIAAPGETRPTGFLISGLSPRRILDTDYRSFLNLVADHIGTSIANARAYDEARKRAEALAEIDRAKTAFFSNVSHEFRTPLTLMLGPLEDALKEGDLSDRQHDRLQVAHRNSLRLLKLVNSLLDFSRIEANRTLASYQPTDLAALTADLVSGFRSAIDAAGLYLEIDCRTLPEQVYVDRDMWEKVVLNLLSNALKFTLQGGITVALYSEQNQAVLIVRDTGEGIPARELPRIFERFHRIEGQRSRSFEGSGIGLALVQELVRLHGGTIAAKSEQGCGTTFTVSVPFGVAHLPADRIIQPTGQGSTAARINAFVSEALQWLPDTSGRVEPPRQALDTTPGLRPRVLLADDNADMRTYVHRLLGERYEVIAVSDGQAAIDEMHRVRPDLVLTDVMMPRLDGFGLLRAIRAEPTFRDMPVILLSARAGAEARVEGLGTGADDYVTKPFFAQELLARVEANLSLARLRREAVEALRARTVELEMVLETVPVAVWFTYDRDARTICGNRPAGKLLRMATGSNASLSAPDAERPDHFRLFRDGVELAPNQLPLQRAVRGEAVPPEEQEIRFNDGSTIVVLIQALPIRDAEGRIIGAICIALDITERKHTEAIILDREERLRASLAASDTGTFRWNPHTGEFLEFDENLKSLFGISAAEPVRATDDFIRYVHQDDRPDLIGAMDACCRGGDLSMEYRVILPDGRIHWLYERARMERDEWGNPTYLVGACTDVTKRRRAEEDLRRLNERLEQRVAEEIAAREQTQARLAQAQRMEALGQLAGGIAHDFNNVLQAVIGGLTLIERRPDAAARVRHLARMAADAAERGKAITSRLLAFARRSELRAAPVEPLPLLDGLQEILGSTLGPTIAVLVKIDPDSPPLMADKTQLETVLVNLAVNARDAMPAGGELILSASPVAVGPSDLRPDGLSPGDYVRLDVTDTGIGMDAATLARASEPFFTTKPVGQGTGLGLAMARGFAQQSHGGFAIRSAPGRGTTVSLWFPKAVAADPDRDNSDTEPRSRNISRARTLVVDDDSMIRAVLVEQVRALGHQVVEASDGLVALELLDSGIKPDLLVTDFAMPGMNGLTLIDEARQRLPELPVLLLTGYADAGFLRDIERAQDNRTTALRKPISEDALAQCVAALLGNEPAAVD